MRKVLLIVMVGSRLKKALSVQEVLTRYGCLVKTRLGLHDSGKNVCSDAGLIILELLPQEARIKSFKKELDALPGVKTRLVSITA
ncbi:MAG: hypothetical protein WC583_03710 [Candidatus Omnitrophota bacterium]|jgi:hypothetical protein